MSAGETETKENKEARREVHTSSYCWSSTLSRNLLMVADAMLCYLRIQLVGPSLLSSVMERTKEERRKR